jgi:hypothetical protein
LTTLLDVSSKNEAIKRVILEQESGGKVREPHSPACARVRARECAWDTEREREREREREGGGYGGHTYEWLLKGAGADMVRCGACSKEEASDISARRTVLYLSQAINSGADVCRLGLHETEEAAAHAYDLVAIKRWGREEAANKVNYQLETYDLKVLDHYTLTQVVQHVRGT